jgi:flagellar hook-associated protein 3 FlgL
MTGNNGDGQYSYFYVSGKTSQGVSFKHVIQESVNAPVSDLLSKIENEYSGTVTASLNDNGEIELRDKVSGSSQMEFNIVGYDNTVPLSPATKATAGVTAGSTTVTMGDASGIAVGDVLNFAGIGQYTVASKSGNDVTFTLPLANSKDSLATDVDVRKVGTSAVSSNIAATKIGDTTISLADVTNFNNGDTVSIGGVNYTISSVNAGANTITIPAPGLTAIAANNSAVSDTTSGANSTIAALTLNQTTNIPLVDVTSFAVGDSVNIGGVSYTISAINTGNNTINISSGLTAASITSTTVTDTTAIPPKIPNGSDGARITEFTKSGSTIRDIGGTVTGSANYWDHTQFGFNVEMRRKDSNAVAKTSDLLSDVLGSTPTSSAGSPNFQITLNGNAHTLTLNTSSTVGDYVSQIQQALDSEFGQNKFQASLDNQGKVAIKDITISDDNKSLQSSILNSLSLTVPANTFGRSNGLETSKIYFDKTGSTLTGNVPQIIKSTNTYTGNDYATDSTKLSQVAGLTSLSPVDQATGASAIGANTISVTNGSQYSTGDMLTIGGNRYKIASVSGNTITLSSNLTTAVAAGDSFNADKVFKMDIVDKSGVAKTVTMNLGSTMSTFSITDKASGTTSPTFEIVNAANPQGHTTADNMTYRQLMDVIGMATSNSLPPVANSTAVGANTLTLADISAFKVGDTVSVGNSGTYTISSIANGVSPAGTLTFGSNFSPAASTTDEVMKTSDYNSTVQASRISVQVNFDQQGRIKIQDMTSSSTNTKIMFAMYDSDVNSNFSTTRTIGQATDNALSLNSNTSLTINDPHISFFDQLQQAIDAVNSGKARSDYTNIIGERNTGIQGAIDAIDQVLQHTIKKHTQIGAISNAFQSSHDRAETLQLNVTTIRSQFLDTDIASASAELNQRMLSYQAMLSVLSKIKDLSLVKYL